jgi:hypothetical protein
MHPPDNDFFWGLAISLLIGTLLWMTRRFEQPGQTATQRRMRVLSLIRRREKNLLTIALRLNLTRAKALVLIRTMEKEGTVTIRKQRGGLTGRMHRICGITAAGLKDLSLIGAPAGSSLETRQSS